MSKKKHVRAARPKTPPPVGKNQRSDRQLWLAGGSVVVAIVAAIAITSTGSSGSYTPPKPVDEAALTALQIGPAPWGTAIAGLAVRLKVLALPALSHEGTSVHIHQHLDLFVSGRAVPVAAGIGIDDNTFISPIHTHDASGVIHVESPTKEHFTLGQFFAIWGVRFTSSVLGDYRTTKQQPIRFFVDGRLYRGNPTRLVLASHQEIAVVVGRSPASVPASYSFPGGE